ncbi:hypothetical protein J7J47_08945 [Halomonas sp. ISL-60]|uniref:hypothetical protein n=1 Tax=Halomonas sp. ISL-56 TaxID=2819149 RepID=UPI001BE65631|nr:hypothetical protein [Halomonas sp. ISL-56]MBT2772359.1 hypothetical protein [Halomonas sp. ISL-60]MBT2800796.1 hypothetical protein [Halomonas sp. ISL-56]
MHVDTAITSRKSDRRFLGPRQLYSLRHVYLKCNTGRSWPRAAYLPQAAFSGYHSIIRDELELDENSLLLCGIALAYEDPDAPENAFITERESAGSFTTFHSS